MKIISNCIVVLITILLVSACGDKKPDTTVAIQEDTIAAPTDTMVEPVEIIGKTGFIVFAGGIKVEESFISDTVLHWKFTDNKGTVTEGDELITYKKLNEHMFFLNWIEKTGLTVSQILDVKNGTATAFTSAHDEKSDRGQRSSRFLEGTLEVK